MVTIRYGLLFLSSLLTTSLADQFSERLSKELQEAQLLPGESEPMIQAAAAVDRSTWTATASDEQGGNPASAAIDGSNSTFWHSQFNPNLAFPHSITVDMKQTVNLNGVVITPRLDGNSNGNIGQHSIQTSTDGTTWTTISFGTFIDDNSIKTIPIKVTPARYLRITATSEAGNRGTWTSISDISVTTGTLASSESAATAGQFGPTVRFPITPVSAALVGTTGRLLLWSSWLPNDFTGSTTGRTYTTTYDPASGTVSQELVSAGHDMFCPGVSLDAQGNIIVTGGNSAPVTSQFTVGGSWGRKSDMTVGRGYQAQTTLSDGRIFTIGGSWSGGLGNKNGEVWNPSTNAWSALSGAPVAPMLTADTGGVYRSDNHAWLFAWKDSYVLQAGPSKAMNWYRIVGSGTQTAAGNRASDADAMCGNSVMYDAVAGKILTAGGAPDYQKKPATANAHIITLGTPPQAPTVQKVASMQYARGFASGVVLPDGKVYITGGQSMPVPFSDDTAILTPELFNPATGSWTTVTQLATPRVYHSVALLMLDGTVFIGGGGLCGNCATNHPDGQFWSPPYLFTSSGARATRPVISSVSATSARVGTTFTVTTNSAVTRFSLIRYSSTTHTVNSDQRRIPLTATSSSGNTYTLRIPSDAGVALPGQYMVFALNSAGVPSIAKSIRITL